MSAKTLTQASNLNEVGTEQPRAVDEQGDTEPVDENLIYAFSHMTKDQIIMYMKGKGKGKYNSWKGKGGKGNKKGNEDGKGGKGGKDGKKENVTKEKEWVKASKVRVGPATR